MLYLDASALAKRYVPERGRRALADRLQRESTVCTSALSYAEIHVALARKRRAGQLSADEFIYAREGFERDWQSLGEVPVSGETLSWIRAVAEETALRGMDAIHLATALWAGGRLREPIEFCTSDKSLKTAAAAFGLPVFDPADEERGR